MTRTGNMSSAYLNIHENQIVGHALVHASFDYVVGFLPIIGNRNIMNVFKIQHSTVLISSSARRKGLHTLTEAPLLDSRDCLPQLVHEASWRHSYLPWRYREHHDGHLCPLQALEGVRKQRTVD
jgi:hypothetical protein